MAIFYNRKKTFLSVLTIAMLAVLGFACKQFAGKPDGESSGSSIDNLTNNGRNNLNLNYCTTDQKEFAPLAAEYEKKDELVREWFEKNVETQGDLDKDKYRADIVDVLTAAPLVAAALFFRDGAGKIILADGLPKICEKIITVGKGFNAEAHHGNLITMACVGVDKDEKGNYYPVIALGTSAGNPQSPEMTLAKNIRHSLIRALAMFYSNAVFNKDGKEFLTKVENSTAGAAFTELANRYERFVEALEYDLTAKGSRSSRFDELKTKPGFNAAVLAEALDSYYCSKKSHMVFAHCFPSAYHYYTFLRLEKKDYNPKACEAAQKG